MQSEMEPATVSIKPVSINNAGLRFFLFSYPISIPPHPNRERKQKLIPIKN